jgi:2-polyprenyl-3-methyl-5-hydroxy-6-metoxy-1,4-benzoquinol methylase
MMDELLIPCINCGNKNYRFTYKGKDRLHHISGTFNIYQCITCGIYYLYPKLPRHEMAKYYPSNYIGYIDAIEDDPNILGRINKRIAINKRCKQVTKRMITPGKILDIGCATGVFLNEMMKSGWDCYGVEPNSDAASYAKTHFNLNVHVGTLLESDFEENSFDTVTMWEVLEHIDDTDQYIEEIIRVLRPGGKFIISLPNADSWEKCIFGQYWIGWEVPRHYLTFTRKSLIKYIRKFNFSRVELFSFTGRHGAFMLSLDFFLESIKSNMVRKIIRTIFDNYLTRIMMLPWFFLAERLNRSTIMSISATK